VRVAVNDFAISEVNSRVSRVVAESLVFELRKLERTSVISFEEVRQMLDLEAGKQAVGCSDDSCLSQIADALGVDYLVTGTLAKVGDTHVLGLRLIDQAAATAERSVNKVLPAGSGVEFLGEIGPAVEVLFPGVPLRPGESRGIAPELAKRLTPPPLSPVIFWGTAATGGALLVGSGVAGVLQATFQADYRATAERAKTGVESGAALVKAGDNAQTAELAGWVLLASGIAVAGLGAAMVPLTDFQGIGAEP
jgi:TolB-like protein